MKIYLTGSENSMNLTDIDAKITQKTLNMSQ